MRFSIDNWFYWENDYCDINSRSTTKNYDLSNIPVIQRRRLPEVAKRMNAFTKRLSEQKIPIIYATHNGEISQTLSIIRTFKDDVSPAKFSLSVHNAIAGLLSIIHKNNQPYQTIDSMSGLLEVAITEAYALLSHYNKVGIVYYDEELPVLLGQNNTGSPLPSLRVFGLLLSAGDDYALSARQISMEKSSTIHNECNIPTENSVCNTACNTGGTTIDMCTEMNKIYHIVDFLSSQVEQKGADKMSSTMSVNYSNTQWIWEKK